MDSKIIGKFETVIGDKGYDSERRKPRYYKKHGLLAIIPARNKDVPIYLKEKQKEDEKALARRVQKKVNS